MLHYHGITQTKQQPLDQWSKYISIQKIEIDLYIVVEYGTRIKMVAEQVSNNVRYRVEKVVGIPVEKVNIHIRSLRVSNTD
ncbi:MAG: Asp23/Gls24 family envelope stress response protein [Anaerolineaceae bacterium]|nr:Asp23/Gls24 family envelope stress response protein [Anaerolineaceae bacterium]